MTYFAVLVIADDVAAALQPFHNDWCTGIDDAYVVEVDVHDAVVAEYAALPRSVRNQTDIDTWADGAWSRNIAGRFVERTNPNKQWDYWQIGGRYPGLLRAKTADGTSAPTDQCQASALDWAAMTVAAKTARRRHVDDCLAETDLTEAAFGNLLARERPFHWAWRGLGRIAYRDRSYADWLAAQPGVDRALVHAVRHAGMLWPDMRTGQTVADWIADAPALETFAVIKDGQWHERGQAPAWNPDTAPDWSQTVTELLADLSPDDWLTIVDCHC